MIGKFSDDEGGEINLAVGYDPDQRLVVMDFGRPTRYLALTPDEADELARVFTVTATYLRNLAQFKADQAGED